MFIMNYGGCRKKKKLKYKITQIYGESVQYIFVNKTDEIAKSSTCCVITI